MMTKRQQWQKLLSTNRHGSEQKQQLVDRTSFQQDYDRIIFSSAFRRLKDKTQVFPLSRSDYVRTRLTHSLETSCVGRSLGTRVGREIVARHFLSEIDASDFGAIVAAACLAHDIGNPPFGHAGEDAVRSWFRNNPQYTNDLAPEEKADLENFEGNAQGFRILTRLQNPANPGLQLSIATLATFTKYPRPAFLGEKVLTGQSSQKNGYFWHDRQSMILVANESAMLIKETDLAWHRHPLSFLVEVADDLCYLIIDMEDAARLGFIPYNLASELLLELAGNSINLSKLNQLPDEKEKLEYLRAKAIGVMIDSASEFFLDVDGDILSGNFDQDILSSISAAKTIAAIRQISTEYIYVARPALEIEIAGFEVLGGLLSLFIQAVEAIVNGTQSTREQMLIKLLPPQFLSSNGKPDDSPYIRRLQITDFVTGMTDSYAIDLYRKLKGIDLPL